MDSIEYKFTLPDYSKMPTFELIDNMVDLAKKIKATEEITNIPMQVRKMTSLFLRLNFITIELEKRHPEQFNKAVEQSSLDVLLSNLNIKKNGQD